MIALRGMEMPQNCIGCPMFHKLDGDNNYQCVIMRSFIDSPKSRADGCPLVEIVTCKDCKHWDKCSAPRVPDKKEYHYCPMEDFNTAEDYFCAYGERR